MIEQITSDNWDELRSRCLHTIGFLKSPSGKKHVVSVDEIGPQYTKVSASDGTEYTLNSDTGCELEFTQVPSQWFQVDPGHIVYATRKPERQWKRGICQDNTLLQTVKKNDLYTIPSKIEILSQILNPEGKDFLSPLGYPAYKCGIWGKYFAWVETKVWLKDLEIGTVDHKLTEIKLIYPQFQQELRDALVRSNSLYSVKVNE